MKNWKIILTLWISLGIATSGYFYLFPKTREEIVKSYRYDKQTGWQLKSNELESKRFEISILVTIVGSILIFGFGKYYRKE